MTKLGMVGRMLFLASSASFFDRLAEIFGQALEFCNSYVLDALKDIGIGDVIDILILSALLFYIYRFIRNRRAGRLAMGVLFVIAAMLLSMALNLRALKFILQNFYQVGMIAIIVIFQSDLRAALERFGTTPIKGLKNLNAGEVKKIVEMADVLSEAADALARTRTGALIVIERDTKLGEYLGQGVILNAEMSSPLLRNIFVNKAPLHDGAVIVRGQRIYAAGCYLPLSGKDVNKDLGTRHRAALGLSEASDAIVIVVSEETGTISIARDGELERNFNYTTLKQKLVGYLMPEDGTIKKISRRAKRRAERAARKKSANKNNED